MHYHVIGGCFSMKDNADHYIADLASKRGNVCETIAKLRADKATAHIPIIAFADEAEESLQAAARAAGATNVVTDAAILSHLQQLIEQALQVD